jgi:2-C-methyl-D-erythritol 4-phosphate cytidylyltransferase/2-C-methyl-D-erythritol 2,4-cyclodiphosphate synthase
VPTDAGEEAAPGVDAIVVAAGTSARMAGADKLAARVAGRPLLAWTLAGVAAAPRVERIVLVAPPERVAWLADGGWLPPTVVATVDGGARRHESVASGLAALDALDAAGLGPPAARVPDAPVARDAGASGDRIVLVHDGARPVVPADLVDRVTAAAALHGAAIPVTPVVETLKRIDGDVVTTTVDRSGLGASQTPQAYRRSVLAAAFARFPPAGPEAWTDEAALLEACSMTVHAVPGDPTNLKVTFPDDLARVAAHLPATEALGPALSSPTGDGAAPLRVGLGEDLHPFGPGGPLVLGGVAFPGAPRLHGHSDGDVVLHAVADALLGAAGLGDLGRVAPAGPETPRGVDSGSLLARVVALVRAAGWTPSSIDLTVTGARPRLGTRLPEMAAAIADALAIPAGRVSVKASTGNLVGPEGAGRAIGARAIVVVVPVPPEPAS